MSTWGNETKSSDPTWANQDKNGGGGIDIGNPIGLLLALTYAEAQSNGTTWDNQAKSS